MTKLNPMMIGYYF